MKEVSIVEDRDHLTKAENKICDYIEQYLNNSIYMTVSEIASNCGVGEASVTRFCKKLGFRSFLEFKMTMAQEYRNGNIDDEVLNNSFLDMDESSILGVLKKNLDDTVSLIKTSLKKNDYTKLEEVANYILHTKKVYFVGLAQSQVLALDAYYKFSLIGIDCVICKDTENYEFLMNFMKSNECVFVFSHNKDSEVLNDLLEKSLEKDIKIISLVENLMSRLSRLSTYIISYAEENIVIDANKYINNSSQMYMLNILFNYVLSIKENLNVIT